MQTKLKICGVTQAEQARTLLDLGVDYIGLIFHPASPRSLGLSAAPEFKPYAKHLVAVAVDQDLEQIQLILKQTGAGILQCHGASAQQVQRALPASLQRLFVLSFKQQNLPDYQTLLQQYQLDPERDFLLFDSIDKADNAYQTIQTYPGFRYFIAGRLQPEDLPQTIASYQPYAIDMASQIEITPGVKNLTLVKQCLEQIQIAGGNHVTTS